MPRIRLALRLLPLLPALFLPFITTATPRVWAADAPAPPPSPATKPPEPAAAPPPIPPRPPEVEVLPDVEVVSALRQPARSVSPLAPTPVLEAPRPVGSLSGRELDDRRKGSLGATLAHEPGVANSGFAPGAGRPVIRGQGGERVRVLENGTGSLDVSGLSDDHAVPVDPSTVESFEVVRGPATVRYGAGAIGGVVFVHDGRIPDGPIGARFTGRFGGDYTTVDEGGSGYGVLSGQAGCWCWRASGFGHETQDYDIPGLALSQELLDEEGNPSGVGVASDTLPNSWSRAYGGSAGLSRIGSWGYAGLAVSTYSSEYGLPNEEEVHIDLDRLRFDASGRLTCTPSGLREVNWALAYADYEHTEFEGDEVGTVYDLQSGEGRVEFVRSAWRGWEGVLGLQGAYADLTVTGEEALLPGAKTATGAGFVDVKRALASRWVFEAGARLDVTSIDSVEDTSFTSVSLATSLLYQPSRSTVWALALAYTERPPTAVELYADGPHVATESYEVGDPDLGLERALGADVSWRTDGARFSGTATVFGYWYPNFIALDPTGVTDLDSGFEIYDYVGHEAAFVGFEAELTWHAWRCGSGVFDVEARADAVRAEDLDTNDPLPRMPPLRVGGGLRWTDPRWSARLEVLRAFAQDRVAADELPTDGYTLLDAGVSRTWTFGRRSITASLQATNLLDDEIRLSTSFTKDVAPEPGRSLRLSLEMEF